LLSVFLGSLGLLLANYIRQLENFAGVMNFVIFPLFFLSSALYPLSKMQEASALLYQICALNPFTNGVELLRFSLYQRLATQDLAILLAVSVTTFALAVRSFHPKANKQRKN
jgi:ABC-2 type transport system permease protein